MIISKHSVENFRNIEQIEIFPDPEMNIIYGENGQGKTNLIESIWIMTGFHSFKSRKNNLLIQQGREEAKISTAFYSQQREQNAEMKINQKKDLLLNEVNESSPRAMMGRFPAVVFSPNTLGIVQNGPGERRKLLDVALTEIKPNYAVAMSQYIKVVEQRNSMLKKYGEKCFNMPYFSPWNEQLAVLGAKIIRYRLDYIERLNEVTSEIYNGISSGREKFSFYYDFSKENISDDEIIKKLLAEIEKNKDADIRKQYTNAGPHTHDLILCLNDKDARTFGSQGQQRSCALSLKLGEASIIEKLNGESPVVLLDDVMSELDEKRQNFILNYLDNRQVFLTCCDPSQMMRGKKGKTFEVTNGKIK